MAFLAGAYLYGFTIYTYTIASLEQWVGENPRRMAAFFVCTVASLVCLSYYRRHTHDQTIRIVYEDAGDPVVRQLNLTS
jgi:hypothetical protein